MADTNPDHLDRIAAEWKRERPELALDSLALLGRLFRTTDLAHSVLSEGLRQYELPAGWFDLLAALRRAGAPYERNPTELMKAMMLSSGGVTKRLDRLADAGLVERKPDPNDRRGTLVRLTHRGKATIDKAIETHIANEDNLLRPLTAADRRTLDELLRRLLASLEPSGDAG
jgi:DNA-binding MarR family transcriptional regulator